MTTSELQKLTPHQLAELHALPDDALATPKEAAAFLRLKLTTLAWHRCHGSGPKYVHVGTLVRYRIGDLREYVRKAGMGKFGVATRSIRNMEVEG